MKLFYCENECGFPILKYKTLVPTESKYTFIIHGETFGSDYDELVIWKNGISMHLKINQFGIQECIQVGFCEFS
jgi:hypothetical protein